MEHESPIILVIARYHLRQDAEADLDAVARFIRTKSVVFYDAALLTTDAWDQLHLTEWATPLLSGAADALRRAIAALERDRNPLHHAPPALGKARAGLARRDLERAGNELAQDAAALVVAVQTTHTGTFLGCFSHALRVAHQELPVDGMGKYPGLSEPLTQLLDTA